MQYGPRLSFYIKSCPPPHHQWTINFTTAIATTFQVSAFYMIQFSLKSQIEMTIYKDKI